MAKKPQEKGIESLKEVNLSRLKKGTLVRLTTESGSEYVVTIVDKGNYTVQKKDDRLREFSEYGTRTDYRGVIMIAEKGIIQVGKGFAWISAKPSNPKAPHSNGTSYVTKIDIIHGQPEREIVDEIRQ